MKAITVKFQRTPEDIMTVGRLAEHDNRTYFEYDPTFLQTGLEISPFKLPAHPSLIEHQDHTFGLLPGVFDESLPDGCSPSASMFRLSNHSCTFLETTIETSQYPSYDCLLNKVCLT